MTDVASKFGSIPPGFLEAPATAGSIGDPDGTRTITSIIALLVVLGVALLMVAIWLWRSTRPDPELLAPLEAMGERQWRQADPVWQRRRLDELRPDGAEPLAQSAAPPEVDESFDAGPAASGFDDLGDVSLRLPPDSEFALDATAHAAAPAEDVDLGADPDDHEIVEAAPRRDESADDALAPPTGGRIGYWTPEHLARPAADDVPDPPADATEGKTHGSGTRPVDVSESSDGDDADEDGRVVGGDEQRAS